MSVVASKVDIRTASLPAPVSVAGKRNSEARDKGTKMAPKSEYPFAETKRSQRMPPIRRQFASNQEISGCQGLRGGPGSCATAQQFQELGLSNLPKRDHRS